MNLPDKAEACLVHSGDDNECQKRKSDGATALPAGCRGETECLLAESIQTDGAAGVTGSTQSGALIEAL